MIEEHNTEEMEIESEDEIEPFKLKFVDIKPFDRIHSQKSSDRSNNVNFFQKDNNLISISKD